MNDGRAKAPRTLCSVLSILTRFFILTISQYAKTALAAANAANYPAEAIEMKDEHPVWIKETCFMCFGCLRLLRGCPPFVTATLSNQKCAIAKV